MANDRTTVTVRRKNVRAIPHQTKLSSTRCYEKAKLNSKKEGDLPEKIRDDRSKGFGDVVACASLLQEWDWRIASAVTIHTIATRGACVYNKYMHLNPEKSKPHHEKSTHCYFIYIHIRIARRMYLVYSTSKASRHYFFGVGGPWKSAGMTFRGFFFTTIQECCARGRACEVICFWLCAQLRDTLDCSRRGVQWGSATSA